MVDDKVKQIAHERLCCLFSIAERSYRQDPVLAQRYVDVARKIAMSAKIRLPNRFRRQVCRHCKSYMVPGVSCRVRTRSRREPHVTMTCLKCGSKNRTMISQKRRKRKD